MLKLITAVKVFSTRGHKAILPQANALPLTHPFARFFHTSMPSMGRHSGATAFETKPRDFSKKQQKRFRQKILLKEEKRRRQDTLKNKIKGQHINKEFASDEMKNLIKELDTK